MFQGGWCFGCRPIVDVTPVLAVVAGSAIPIVRRSWGLTAIFLAILLWSIGVQVVGALAYNPIDWNGRLGVPWVVNGELKEVLYCDYDFVNTIKPPPDPLIRRALERWGKPSEDRCTRLDVDDPRYRGRLWDFDENPVFYFATHFWASRAAMARGNHRDVGLNLIGRVRSHGYADCSQGLW